MPAKIMLAIAINKNAQKKYFHVGGRGMRTPPRLKMVVDHMSVSHQITKVRLTPTSTVESTRRMRLGSRTGGSLRGFQFSRKPGLTRSRIANTSVTAPNETNISSQNVPHNGPKVRPKLAW